MAQGRKGHHFVPVLWKGEFVNNSIFPDWMMIDEIIPGQVVTHNMDSESLSIADVLSKIVGVPIGNGPL